LSNKQIFSATEIDSFLLCRKKWAFSYLDNLDPAPSKATELGSAVHKVLENYLRTNSITYDTTEGRIASTGLKFLPENLDPAHIERHIFFSIEAHIFHGFIDFFHHLGSQIWLIGDHKTCSSFSSALKPEELKTNTQANIYAQWAFRERNADTVKLKWIYYRTKSTPEARLVEASLTKDEALENFQPILQAANDIKKLLDEKALAKDQPKNLSACFKYGRCPYYAACKYDSKEIPTDQNNQLEASATRENSKYTHTESFSINKSNIKQEAFHLFIDCAPTKTGGDYQQTIELSELLKPILTKINTEKELKHYRLAGYGQHVGLIANYLTEHLKINPYDNRTAVLSSLRTPEGCDTLQTLTAAAGKVVRGF